MPKELDETFNLGKQALSDQKKVAVIHDNVMDEDYEAYHSNENTLYNDPNQYVGRHLLKNERKASLRYEH